VSPLAAAAAIWGLWAISWALAAVWSSRAAARPEVSRSMPYWILTVGGMLLLWASVRFDFGSFRRGGLGPRFWSVPDAAGWAMTALVAAGFLFAWWARLHLGSLWSGTVTRKEGHRVVDTGPYRFVRHPIYTGLIAGALGLAVLTGRPLALVGCVLIAVGYWVKARLEEGFLSAELGEAAYGDYRERTPMLIPFVRWPS